MTAGFVGRCGSSRLLADHTWSTCTCHVTWRLLEVRKLLVGTPAVYGHINERLQDDVNHLAKVHCKKDKMARIDEGVRFFSQVMDDLRGAYYRMKRTVTCRAWYRRRSAGMLHVFGGG